MVRSSVLALLASVSLGTLGLASDAFARGGGGHFGGGHFGGGMRDFGGGMRDFRPEARPEMREPRMEERRPEEDHRSADRPEEHHDEADRARDDAHDLNRDAARNDLDHHWNNIHQPVNVGRWDHNQFWNNQWNARNFNCNNCRWGWVGPVFWPFAYGDMFSFAWWPYAATAPFWNYGVDYIMGGLFWPNGAYAWPSGGYSATAYSQTDENYQYARQSHQDIYSAGPADGGDAKQAAATTDDSQKADLATCSGFAPGVSSLPIDKIEQNVKPTGAQQTVLKELEAASSKAEGILKASCPSEPPLTPVGRLDALQKRLAAMVQGVDLVRVPLTKFDSSLSPEQKLQLDAMGGGKAANAAALCSTLNEEFINVPTQEIEPTVNPDDRQKAALDQLDNVSAKAASLLQATCPAQIPGTTEARLEAMDKRLRATVTAMNDVRPALVGFYDSLSDEQKARFNTMP